MDQFPTSAYHATSTPFEIGSPAGLSDIRRALSSVRYENIYPNGLLYVVKASLETKSKDVLHDLSAGSIEVRYFRDISTSVKQLLQ